MDNKDKAIGVFDSGLGGISVLKEFVKSMPSENFIYYGDSANAPYGIKTKKEITDRCENIIEFFIKQGVKAVVIACNTATSASANILRKKYSYLPIIGMEPALKVAADGKTDNTIVVMATPLTLREIVENDLLDDEEVVENQISDYYKGLDMKKINSVVLGCTHFVFYKDYMEKILNNNIDIVDGNVGTANHLKETLRERNELRDEDKEGSVKIFNSSKDEKFITLSKELLNR